MEVNKVIAPLKVIDDILASGFNGRTNVVNFANFQEYFNSIL